MLAIEQPAATRVEKPETPHTPDTSSSNAWAFLASEAYRAGGIIASDTAIGAAGGVAAAVSAAPFLLPADIVAGATFGGAAGFAVGVGTVAVEDLYAGAKSLLKGK